MNKNWAWTFAALTLLSQVSLQAWSMGNQQQTAGTTLSQSFPLSQTQEWYTEESYLLLKPYMENMMYGNKNTFEQPDSSTYNNKIKVKQPEFEWSSGVRVAIGRYLPNHDLWDIGLSTTFYYTQTDDKTKGSVVNNVGFNPSFFGPFSTPRDSGSFDWKLNYWTIDLLVGRMFEMTQSTVFHPYFGVRGSFQYQHGKATFSRFQLENDGSTRLEKGRSGLDNDFWGVGPRVGTAFIYYFGSHFSLLANLSAALLVGAQNLKLNFRNDTTTHDADTGITAYLLDKVSSKDSVGVIRTNVEASIGLGWERWMRNNTVRIAPSVNFEGALWYAMNQLYNFYPAGSATTNIEQRRNGNLGLMGVSFNLQVDF